MNTNTINNSSNTIKTLILTTLIGLFPVFAFTAQIAFTSVIPLSYIPSFIISVPHIVECLIIILSSYLEYKFFMSKIMSFDGSKENLVTANKAYVLFPN